jgi:hypothetical protein
MRVKFFPMLTLLLSLHAASSTDVHAVDATVDLNDSTPAAEAPRGATGADSDRKPATVYRLPETVVTGRQDIMIGIAAAASEGTVGEEQLQFRALARPGELLETVPGLILTQHSGGGKANQWFLRGFNLDHGTDFATSVNGMPVNLPSHGHGQGYADLNFMIPELVQRINFRKGVYYADLGDFSSAGGADLEYYDVLPRSIVTVTGGRYGYVRELYASSPAVGRGHLLNALEIFHEDGPWTKPDDYQKINGVARYSQGDRTDGFSVTAMAYAGKWNSTDQIARRVLGESFSTSLRTHTDFGLYDSLDTSDGGNSHRYSLAADWHRKDADTATQVLAYGFYYDLDLFSNFSYFLGSPEGDQIEQSDARWVGGVKASHTWFGEIIGRDMQNTVGLQVRSDSIRNGLYNTIKRDRVAKRDYSDSPDPTIPATTRSDQIWEASLAPYFENRVQWADKVRTVFGLRLDYFHVDVESHLTANSGTADDVLVSPKGSVIFGPWADTELYVSGGQGFHSNDARGATQHVDPLTREAVEDDDLIVRSYGAEIGARTTYVPGLQSTLSFWWLHLGSELVFVGDAGTTEASDPSQRYGVELANYYEPNPWVSLDADVSFSRARFTHTVVDDEAGRSGKHIPEAVESVVATGVSFHQPDDQGFFSELRLRYFGPRDLSVSGSPRSGATALLSANLGYHVNDHVTIGAELFNILDREDHDIDYYYPSFVPGVDPSPDPGNAPDGVNDVHFKPVEPISFRIAMSITW